MKVKHNQAQQGSKLHCLPFRPFSPHQSKQKQHRLKAFFLSGKKVFNSYPSYMYVIAHLTNSLKINFHTCLTYSFFVLIFLQV